MEKFRLVGDDIELVRHVRSAKGAAYYHLPIGSPLLGHAGKGTEKVKALADDLPGKTPAPKSTSVTPIFKPKAVKFAGAPEGKVKLLDTEAMLRNFDKTHANSLPVMSKAEAAKSHLKIQNQMIQTKLDAIQRKLDNPNERQQMLDAATKAFGESVKNVDDSPSARKSFLTKAISHIPLIGDHFKSLSKNDKAKIIKDKLSFEHFMDTVSTYVMGAITNTTILAIASLTGAHFLGVG